MEMNAFVHFSINTFTDKEWGFGNESPHQFNPVEFDPAQWIRIFKKTGFHGVILTSKHHDGFCLWPSSYTQHDVASSKWRNGAGDIVGEVAKACQAGGLRFGIYVSPWDRNAGDYGSDRYITYYRNQLRELLTAYGPIFEMWFDGANGGDGFYGGANTVRRIDGSTYYRWPETLDLVRKMEPGIIFFSDAGPGVRWVGNEKGIAGDPNWNMISPDTLFAGKSGIEPLLQHGNEHGTAWIPAETDVSIRPGWFYHAREDSSVKTSEQLFNIYLTSVGRGSTLLLNVPPDKRGKIHATDSASLIGFRNILDEVFSDDLSTRATLSAGSWRGSHDRYAVRNLTDPDFETYWATDDKVQSEWISLTWDELQPVRYIIIQEYIPLGQRVQSFRVEAKISGRWKEVAGGTTIGYKRIVMVQPIETNALRIVLRARACLALNRIGVY